MDVDVLIRRKVLVLVVALKWTTTFIPPLDIQQKAIRLHSISPNLILHLGMAIKTTNGNNPLIYHYFRLGRLFRKGEDSPPPPYQEVLPWLPCCLCG